MGSTRAVQRIFFIGSPQQRGMGLALGAAMILPHSSHLYEEVARASGGPCGSAGVPEGKKVLFALAGFFMALPNPRPP